MKFAFPVVLASASPRRKELLRYVVDSFEVWSPDVDETPREGELPHELALRLAAAKAGAAGSKFSAAIVIAADTVVGVPVDAAYTLLGKPVNATEASAQLHLLSGREHLVCTGVCISSLTGRQSFVVESRVRFRALSSNEIEAYVATGEPLDKAGSYAIQGGAAKFIHRMEGSHSNIVGLPLDELRFALRAFAATD